MQLLSYLLLGLIHAHGDSDKNDYEEVKAKNIKVLSIFFQRIKKAYQACANVVGEDHCLHVLFNDDYFWN